MAIELRKLPHGLRLPWVHMIDALEGGPVHELKVTMGQVVKQIYALDAPMWIADEALAKCALRREIWEQGISLAARAGLSACEQFRAVLVARGGITYAARFAEATRRPLTREEILRLGHNNSANYYGCEVEKFLALAAKTPDVTELDLRRLRKQLPESEYVDGSPSNDKLHTR